MQRMVHKKHQKGAAMETRNKWAISPEHPGYRVKTIQHGTCTIRILRPELSEKERIKRETHVKAVAERVLSDYYNRKERKRP